MADYVGFGIQFAVPFEPVNVRTFFTTLQTAVRENWALHRDALSRPVSGGHDLDVDALVCATVPEKMKPSIADAAALHTDGWISFAFGPLSQYCGLLTVGRSREGKLFAWVSVCDSEMLQDDAGRFAWRREEDPGFEDPRFLPEPLMESGISKNWNAYMDQWEEVWRENEKRSLQYYRDRTAVWAVSAACLRNIAERFMAAFPVETYWMDADLQPEHGASASAD